LKLLLALKHRQIPPSLHFETSNPAIDFASGPFYVNTRLEEWKANNNQPRRAAISSFGIGGTNAHMVIEEAPPIERVPIQAPGYVVALSARTAEQLKQQAQNLLAFVKRTPGLAMNDLSFSLFAGRMHLSHRLSCLARTPEDLARLLEQWVETGTANQVYSSEIPEGKIREQISLKRFGNYCIEECRNSPNAANYLENLAAIADLYVQGYSLDFPALFSPGSRRIPLPTYPFAREHCWVDIEGAIVPRPTATASVGPDPVQTNGAAAEPTIEAKWLFSSERPFIGRGVALANSSMGAAEKMELFLKQETALQLQQAMESIPTDQSYFDLGLSSLGIADLIQKIQQLLGVDLLPSVLFEYRDIQSLAAYLAATYPSKIDALSVSRKKGGQQNGHPVSSTPAPEKEDSSEPARSSCEPATVTRSETETSNDRVLEEVVWQETSPGDGYEKVTF
jgi:acyl transferase domain-containing protein